MVVDNTGDDGDADDGDDGGFGGHDDCQPHGLTIKVLLPDREVPNGEHPVHIDLKVLGIKPVGLASLDLRILFITMLFDYDT